MECPKLISKTTSFVHHSAGPKSTRCSPMSIIGALIEGGYVASSTAVCRGPSGFTTKGFRTMSRIAQQRLDCIGLGRCSSGSESLGEDILDNNLPQFPLGK